MLRPTKHSDPQLTVLPLAAELLARVREARTMALSELRDLANTPNRDREPLFVPALSVLFLLGLVEYRRKTDSFEYVGP